MKLSELKEKTEPELKKLLEDDGRRLQQLRFDLVSGKVKNIREIRWVKREIARILTLLKTAKERQNNNKEKK